MAIYGVPHSFRLVSAASPGQPLVFIHGWLLSQQYWKPVIENLQLNYCCLTYDLRGFGESSQELARYKSGLPEKAIKAGADFSPYGLAAYARDLEALLEHLGLSRVWLIGHSLGGSIALWAAFCYPERVHGVICINAGGGIYIRQDFERFRAVGQRIVEWRPGWMQYFPLLELAFTRLMVKQPLDRRWGRQRLLDLLAADSEAALQSLLVSTTESAVHQLPFLVQSLTQPVFFLAGKNDRVMERKYVAHLASFHNLFEAQGNVIDILDCGHIAMLEQPEQVSLAIQDCLKSPLG